MTKVLNFSKTAKLKVLYISKYQILAINSANTKYI